MNCENLDGLDENDNILVTEHTCYLVYKIMDIANTSATDVFLSWYNQGQDYNYTKEPKTWNAGI